MNDPKPDYSEFVAIAIICASFVFSVIFSTGCGGAYTVAVAPVDVNVHAELTITDLMAGFRIQCRRELGNTASSAEVTDCASLKLANLISDIELAVGQ